MNNILLIAETIENQLLPTSYELIVFAKEMLKIISGKIIMIIPGERVQVVSEEVARTTGIDVIALENEYLLYYNSEILTRGITEIINEHSAAYVCFLHTTRGCHIAPAIAISTGASCITAVESLLHDDDSPIFQRSVFGGKLNMEIVPTASRSVLTILPGAFPQPQQTEDIHTEPGSVDLRTIPHKPLCLTSHGIIKTVEDNKNLEEADVIVSVGRGIGKEENINIIREVSELFSKSAIGASRPMCDLGWLPHPYQIGTTGKTVSPRLYIACGISGTSQHIAGMRASQWIVAINRDPQAAIFSIADYGVIEDITTFLPLLVKKYHELFK